jgi:hypothetical protein
MTVEELQKAMKENGTVAIAHLVRNDLLVAYKMIKEAQRNIAAAHHRLSGTMQSLQGLIDSERVKKVDTK